MKKTVFLILFLSLILVFCSCGIFGDKDTENNDNVSDNSNQVVEEKLKFEKTPDGRYYNVVGIGTYSGVDVVIPKLYNDRKVEGVLAGAFAGNTRIKTLIIEDGVEKIGANAFSGCTSLESVRISKSLEKIGGSAFENCTSLKTLIFGNGTEEIGKNAFLNCSSIESFYYEGALTEYRNIDGSTWHALECQNQYFYSKNYPTAAGYFWHWSDNGEPLVWEDYIGNVGLQFEISDDGSYYKVTRNSDFTDKVVLVPKAHGGLPVAEIDMMAFVSSSLEEIILPETIKKISASAFRGSSKLEKINFPNGLISIGEHAFAGCTSLKNVNLPNSLEKIEANAFLGCAKIETIAIPDSVKIVGSEAFYACSALRDVSFGVGVEEIGARAFYLCIEIERVEIPKLVTTIKEGAFADCMNMKEVILHSGVKAIERKALPSSAKVYYESDSASFEGITIGEDNFWTSKVYFYSVSPPEIDGKFWHYDENGNIAIWQITLLKNVKIP